jgi:3-hydroxybutyryl-CoA dehydrogenase
VLRGEGRVADLLAARLEGSGTGFTREPGGEVALQLGDGLLMPTDGRTAAERAAALGVEDLALFDWPIGPAAAGATTPVLALGYALAQGASEDFAAQAASLLRALGWLPQRLADAPGLVVARTISMLVNEASDAVEQGVCDAQGADAAMTLGVNYPAGPFAWLGQVGVQPVVALIDALDAAYRGERYRVSPRLRRASWRPAPSPAAADSPAAR